MDGETAGTAAPREPDEDQNHNHSPSPQPPHPLPGAGADGVATPSTGNGNGNGKRREFSEIRIGVIVGVVLLVVGIPVTLVSGVLQDDIQTKDPKITAQYMAEDEGDRAVVFPHGKATSGTIGARMGCAGKAVAHGAVDFQQTPVSIEVTGVEGRTVAIEDIRAKIVSSSPPSTGTVLSCSGQGTGQSIDIGLDLDEPSPRALTAVHCEDNMCSSITRKRFFGQRYVYLESQKPERFRVTAIAQRHDYAWVIEVDGTVDGTHHTWELTNHGKPFRTAGRGPAGAYHAYAITPFPPYEDTSSSLPPPPARCPNFCPKEAAQGQ